MCEKTCGICQVESVDEKCKDDPNYKMNGFDCQELQDKFGVCTNTIKYGHSFKLHCPLTCNYCDEIERHRKYCSYSKDEDDCLKEKVSCKDKMRNCEDFKHKCSENGKHPKLTQYVRKYCLKTCNLCEQIEENIKQIEEY